VNVIATLPGEHCQHGVRLFFRRPQGQQPLQVLNGSSGVARLVFNFRGTLKRRNIIGRDPKGFPETGQRLAIANHPLQRVGVFRSITAQREEPVACVLAERSGVDIRGAGEIESPVSERRFQTRSKALIELRTKSRPRVESRVRRVADVEALLRAVEHRRRDRHVAVGGIAVGDVLDVAVHAEDLLDDDDGAARFPRRIGAVGVELVAVGCSELDHFAHEYNPRCEEERAGAAGAGHHRPQARGRK